MTFEQALATDINTLNTEQKQELISYFREQLSTMTMKIAEMTRLIMQQEMEQNSP